MSTRKVQKLDKKYFTCYLCSFKTLHKAGLSKHIRKHVIRNTSVANSSYICMKCNSQIEEKDIFLIHLKSHLKEHIEKICEFQNNEEDKRNSQTSSKEDFKEDKRDFEIEKFEFRFFNCNTRIFKCSKCSYTSVNKEEYKEHLQIHKVKNKKTLKCFKCCMDLEQNRNSILKHLMSCNEIKNVSEVQKLFYCSKCSYTTSDINALDFHSFEHKEENSEYFICSECSFSTLEKQVYNKHLLYHTHSKRVENSLITKQTHNFIANFNK